MEKVMCGRERGLNVASDTKKDRLKVTERTQDGF